jgi:hypothetical protein
MMSKRVLKRKNLRKDDGPTGPEKEDYIAEIKKWLADDRTKARQGFEVVDSYGVDYLWAYGSRSNTRERPPWACIIGPPFNDELWICWPLPPEYRVSASQPNERRPEQGVCSGDAPGQPSAEEDGAKYKDAYVPTPQVILRVGIDDELRLWVKFLSPREHAFLLELDIDEHVQLDPDSVELHDDYFCEQMGCSARFPVLEDLDIFEADSASVLKAELARVGIELYCPVTCLGDALPVKP